MTTRAHANADTAHDDVVSRSRESAFYVAWLIIALVSLAGFVALTVAVDSRVVFPFDQPLLDLGRTWQGWKELWQVISESANIPLIVIGLGLVGWLFFTKRRREALLVFLMLAAVTAGSEAIKQLVARDRPSGIIPGIPGVVYSYPSGHELEVVTILGIVAVRIWRFSRQVLLRLGFVILVAVEALLVAVARVALNAHYPTDVLAGLLGGISAIGFYTWWTRPGAWADQPPADSNDAGDARDPA